MRLPARAPRRPWRRSRAASRLRTVAPSGVLEARVPFAALCCSVIVLTLVSVLAINIQLSRGSYAAADLRAERRLLAEREQELRERLAAAEAPDAVRARAVDLGMVPSSQPAFLSLADAAVVAEGAPAVDPAEQGEDPPGGSRPDAEPQDEDRADADAQDAEPQDADTQDAEPQDAEPQDPGSAP